MPAYWNIKNDLPSNAIFEFRTLIEVVFYSLLPEYGMLSLINNGGNEVEEISNYIVTLNLSCIVVYTIGSTLRNVNYIF